MENIKEQFARLYMELNLTDDQSAMIRKLQRDVDAALRQPLVIGSDCTCTKFRETPMINGKHICSICNKPIVQTDL